MTERWGHTTLTNLRGDKLKYDGVNGIVPAVPIPVIDASMDGLVNVKIDGFWKLAARDSYWTTVPFPYDTDPLKKVWRRVYPGFTKPEHKMYNEPEYYVDGEGKLTKLEKELSTTKLYEELSTTKLDKKTDKGGRSSRKRRKNLRKRKTQRKRK